MALVLWERMLLTFSSGLARRFDLGNVLGRTLLGKQAAGLSAGATSSKDLCGENDGLYYQKAAQVPYINLRTRQG